MSDHVTQGVHEILSKYAPSLDGDIDNETVLETIGLESIEIVESVEGVFSVEERSASFPRKECQSSIFLAHLSFRKESDSDQLHYRSWSPFLPRLRHKSSAHQVTGDGVSNDHAASSPPSSPLY